VIALDTNVLLRMLVADDARQCALATRLLLHTRDQGARVLITSVVLAETACVLRSVYGLTRAALTECIEHVVASEVIEFESAGAVTRALRSFRDGSGDFADYLIREDALRRGAQAIVTFDRTLHDEDGFVDPDFGQWPAALDVREETPPYHRRRPRAVGA